MHWCYACIENNYTLILFIYVCTNATLCNTINFIGAFPLLWCVCMCVCVCVSERKRDGGREEGREGGRQQKKVSVHCAGREFHVHAQFSIKFQYFVLDNKVITTAICTRLSTHKSTIDYNT